MRNRNVFIISTISFILLITTSILVNMNQYNIYEQRIDNIFKNIVGVIKEEYPEVKAEDIINISKSDKKMDAGKIKFILLNGMGNAVICNDVTDSEMREALDTVLG